MNDTITGNAHHGVSAQLCTVYATATDFISNGVHGLSTTDSNTTIDGCTASGNQGEGISLDGGLFSLTNTFITRNVLGGLSLYTLDASTDIEFNTIVDNQGTGFDCNTSSVTIGAPNNIIARNQTNAAGAPCTYPSSIVTGTITALKFKAPDTPPYDYHLMPGSIAVDMATLSAVDHDFDGDHRPLGAGNDVGADEVQ